MSAPVSSPAELLKAMRQQAAAEGQASPNDDKTGKEKELTPDQIDFLWQEYEKQLQAQQRYNDAGMDIFPRISELVIKTWVDGYSGGPGKVKEDRNMNGITPLKGQKVFINVCQHDLIGLPEEVTGEIPGMPNQPKELVNQTKLRFPVSAGPLRQGVDKDGSTCLIVDAVVNPELIESCEASKEYRNVTAQFIMENFTQKYAMTFRKHTKFPKLRYKPASGEDGRNPPAQRIRKPKHLQGKDQATLQKAAAAASSSSPSSAKIEEICDDEEEREAVAAAAAARKKRLALANEREKAQKAAAKRNAPVSAAAAAAAAQEQAYRAMQEEKEREEAEKNREKEAICPTYSLSCHSLSGRKLDMSEYRGSLSRVVQFVVRVSCPLMSAADELEVQLEGPDLLVLSTLPQFRPKHHYRLVLPLPCAVIADSAVVQYFKKKKTVKLTLASAVLDTSENCALEPSFSSSSASCSSSTSSSSSSSSSSSASSASSSSSSSSPSSFSSSSSSSQSQVPGSGVERDDWRAQVPLSNRLMYSLC
eukprot:CAMPEP_0175139268 /NCGR_PEP_ID=MMETSP0087-20121206/10808_1 /TAXON_ID=136419 /ORGANISM="Unknown Unknown, Strain D1" /LENGTH=532 /DNA_ID=CAMNT_0016422259 /DNA_START=33 /DNA_END=1631 /DNA_ORIENTATION=+